MIKVGVIGGSGYTGGELLRLLASHSEVELSFVYSRTRAGKPISSAHPDLLHRGEAIERVERLRRTSGGCFGHLLDLHPHDVVEGFDGTVADRNGDLSGELGLGGGDHEVADRGEVAGGARECCGETAGSLDPEAAVVHAAWKL